MAPVSPQLVVDTNSTNSKLAPDEERFRVSSYQLHVLGDTLIGGRVRHVVPGGVGATGEAMLGLMIVSLVLLGGPLVAELTRCWRDASGIPLARVQRWLGHRTPAMTIRYAQHVPEPHADDDAARVEASMVGVANREAEAVQALLKVVEA
jgi:hypothetical protein